MKRLLCILSNLNAGGAETFLMKLYRTIDRSCYQIDFCINVKERCFHEDEVLRLGGKIYRIPSKSENLKKFRQQLSAIIRENGYDHVLRITSSAMGFMDLKIAKQAGAQVCCARSSNASDGDSLKSKIAHSFGRILYSKYVDVKIAPSDLAAKYTFGSKAYEDNQVKILHNGVDIEKFQYSVELREKKRKEFSLNSEIKLIGHVGRFNQQKNHMFLLEVFKDIHVLDSNTRLLLVGNGTLEDQIRQKVHELGINDSVIFAGVRSDVPALLSAMDVFVMPSFFEGMPNTVIEAQATGLPCVIADTITKEADITGLVEYLPLGDANKWAERVLAAIRDERIDTKDNFIANKYDIESVVGEFVKYVFNDSKI